MKMLAGDSAVHFYHAVVAGIDTFSQLPPEVLQYVREYLSTGDALRLRQSRKACANTPLLKSFWRFRFLPGREFEEGF